MLYHLEDIVLWISAWVLPVDVPD